MTRIAMIVTALLLAALPCVPAAAAVWHDGFAAPPDGLGLDGDPRALLHHGDGSLYCGGSFSQAGAATAWFAARLDPVGDSYAWTSLGDMDNRIDALAAWGDSVLAGGHFTTAGGVSVERVAVFHDGAWSAVGDPAAWTWGNVLSLTMHEDTPWAAGSGFVVRWTGTAWEAVTGAGFSGDVFALASFDDTLFAAGSFASITEPSGTSVAAANIAAWDGVWAPLSSGLNGTGYALEVWNDKLAVGGVFTSPGPLLAGWTGGSWTALGPALTGNYVIALADWGTRLLVGGDLNGGGGVSLWNAAYLDGAVWNPMDGGVNAQVRALSAHMGEVAVGGSFLDAGGEPASHLGLWVDPAVAVDEAPRVAVSLDAPAPNPFNPATSLSFRIPRAAHVHIGVHALDGRRVATLLDEQLEAGSHQIMWRGQTDGGRTAASGVYLVRLESGSDVACRRITLMR